MFSGQRLMILPAYFSNVNTFFPIIDEDLFMPRVEIFYSTDRPQLTVIDYCLFYLAVSIGALTEKHISRQPDLLDLLAATSYQQAWDLVQGSFASPREASVQIILLHVSFWAEGARFLQLLTSSIGCISCSFRDTWDGMGVLRPGCSYRPIVGTAPEKPTRHGLPGAQNLTSLTALGHRVPLRCVRWLKKCLPSMAHY